MTLALLITAVGGAWADEVKYPIVYDFEAAANAGENPDNKNGSEINGQKFYAWENETYTDRERKDYKGYIYAEGSKLPEVCHVWLRSDRINGNLAGNGGLKCPSNREMAVDGLTEGLTVTIIYDATDATDKEIVWAIGDGSSQSLGEPRAKAIINGAEAVAGTTTIKSGDVITVTKVTPAANGSGYIVFKVKKDMVIKKIIIDEAKAAEPDIEVTTNAAEEGATFTEATFAMPAFDATAEYELVRDMGYKVAFSGVPTRARLAKDGDGKFHFADGLTFQLLDNIDAANPKDITSAEGITFMVGEVEAVDFEGSTFYQLDKATLVPLADFLADAHLGNYAICAVASTGEYDGSFSSGRIELFQGYEVTVPAGEYITYYKDEALYVENENAQLYTISSVTESEAVLSDAITVAPAETPLLVYNKSQTETLTFLLIPTTDKTPDNVTAATQFVGTLEATTIPASATGADNYALNGYAFVWVKTAIEVGANKCWLHIASQPAGARANTRSITGGNGTTGIESIHNSQSTIDNEGWYDLQGRKLQSAPNRKGIYIHNGKKVVIRK